MVEDQRVYMVAEYQRRCQMQGYPKDAVEKQVESMKDKFKEEAEKQIRLMYTLNSVAEQENISVNDQDIKDMRENLKKANPGREKSIEEQFANQRIVDRLTSRIKTDKIFKFMLDNAKIKTVKVK